MTNAPHPRRQVAKVDVSAISGPSRHFLGLPPEITDGTDARQRLPHPTILLVEIHREGVFLFRFTEDGEDVGDTWHITTDDALEQAVFEYGAAIGPWVPVPDDASDAWRFAKDHL